MADDRQSPGASTSVTCYLLNFCDLLLATCLSLPDGILKLVIASRQENYNSIGRFSLSSSYSLAVREITGMTAVA